MDKIFSYYMPTKIIVTKNSIETLKNLVNTQKTLLIASNRFSLHVKEFITKDTLHVKKIPSHPTFDNLKEISNEIINFDYKLIIAIGGGSVMDSAKFFSALKVCKSYEALEKAIKQSQIRSYKNGFIPIVSVPTTSGTSSEITPWATIWDDKNKKKYSLHSDKLFSKYAIYDASLTLSLSKELTLQTSLDALSHAFESMWNKNANEITIEYAKKSIKLILKYLPLLLKDLDNLELREKIMKASMYAGLAFSNTQTAIAHAMSYYITLHKNIPHGIACSFTLPMLFEVALKKDELSKRFDDFKDLDLKGFFDDLHVSMDFKDYGFSDKDLQDMKTSLLSTQRVQNSLVGVEDL